jgi:cysteinyl-tRNA synthetase
MRLYDSLTRQKQELPEPPGPIRMYVCGSTVYHRVHVGNARPFVLAMWLRSWLRRTGYDVTLVHNITDVDDKVYVEAAAREMASRDLAEWATAWFVGDTDRLGLGRPDVEPRASETMPEIIAFIEELLARDLAYEVQGDVYFRVARFEGYGRLSGAKPDEMIAQEPNELKEDPRDFALWKAQKPAEDVAWDSPWGPGRPGWHIECSAMAEKHLGPAFEIHGGGNDLRFPHHENERAQSCSLGHPFAQIWMHNGMLELDAEKMSKSLGNVVTLQNVLDTWGRETLLVYLLTAHWRKPVDFSDDVLEQAAAQVEAFRNVFRSPSEPAADGAWERFAAALDDDFSTPEALAVMHEWRDHELLERALAVFGLESLAEQAEPPAEAVSLAEEREAARASGDFDTADRLRGEIAALGWEVRDVAGGFQLVPANR